MIYIYCVYIIHIMYISIVIYEDIFIIYIYDNI